MEDLQFTSLKKFNMSQPNFSSDFGFEKFHSKFQNSSFSYGIRIELLHPSLRDEIVAKCLT